MKKIILALAISLFAAASYGATYALSGQPVTISGATAATPIVLTTGSQSFVESGWVYVRGVLGLPAANGIWQCVSVDSTHCTLSGSVGLSAGTYTSGTGIVTPLYAVSTATGPWFSIGKADRAAVSVFVIGNTASATVLIEGSAQ